MKHCLVMSFLLLGTAFLSAKEGTATLNSGKGDQLSVRYSVVSKDGKCVVHFLRPEGKKVSLNHLDAFKIKNLGDVKTLFFDRTGGYEGIRFDSDIATSAFLVDGDKFSYDRSADGYFFMEDEPELSVELLSESATLSIPVYLAKYEKRGRYTIFADCGSLKVELNRRQHGGSASQVAGAGTQQHVRRTITTEEQVEGESDLSENMLAAQKIIATVIPLLDRGYVDEQLSEAMQQLKPLSWKPDINEATHQEIQRLIDRFTALKDADEINAKKKAETEEREALRKQAQHDFDYVRERLENIDQLSEADLGELKTLANQLRRQSHDLKDWDADLAAKMTKTANECDEKFTEIEAAKSRRNVWMVIGGVLLAILMFAGNQSFQHFRNLQSQKGIEKMQNSIAKRAENEARRRAESAVRSRVNKVQGQIRQKSRDTVRNSVNQAMKGVGKNKKNVSI